MYAINPLLCKDFYKVGHIDQYPEGTELIFSNFTPRKSLINGINHSVFFGINYFIKNYLDDINHRIKHNNGDLTSKQYQKFINNTLGIDKFPNHIKNLYDLKYLPIKIYALPELTVVPCGVPALVMFNTLPKFYWLPNMLETLISCSLWGPCTSATIAREYKILLDKYALETSDNLDFVDYQAHDFSLRGMFGLEAGILSGMGHLQYFKGTDNIPALITNNEIYDKKEIISSVPATEHSVMSAGGKESELETFKRIINKIYPEGIVSIVSDTWDLWKVISEYLPILKDNIMSRNGKVVIRPDSGDPVKIICGDEHSSNEYAKKGVVQCLWELFGGNINSKGYKDLDSHIGVIYGDSITLPIAKEILEKLKLKGFSSINIVFGIGSYTYQYNTRDTFGWAMKSTYCEINGKGYPITKNPITDSGTKKSHSGILKVIKVEGSHGYTYKVLENQTWEQFYQDDNELKLIFDGESYETV